MDIEIRQHIPNIFAKVITKDVVNIITSGKTSIGTNLSVDVLKSQEKQVRDTLQFVIVTPTQFSKNIAHQTRINNPDLSVKHYSSGSSGKSEKKSNILYISRSDLVEHLLNPSSKEKCNWPGSLVLIEATQHNDMDLDIILGMWKYCRRNQMEPPRLVLLSQSGFVHDSVKDFMDGLEDSEKATYFLQLQNGAIQRQFSDKTYRVWDQKLFADLTEKIISMNNDHSIRGDFAIFLGDGGEVTTLANYIRKNAPPNFNDKASVVTYTADPVRKGGDKTFGKRNIYLISSEVEYEFMEGNGVAVVFDSLHSRKAVAGPIGGIIRETVMCSKSEMDTRSSYLGKRGGVYIAMTKADDFRKIGTHSTNPFLDLPIEKAMARLYYAGYNPLEIFLNPKYQEKINYVSDELLNLGFINEEFKVTKSGKLFIQLPLGSKAAATLLEWSTQKIPLFPGILAVSCMERFADADDYFRLPGRKGASDGDYKLAMAKFKREHYAKWKGENDMETSMNVIMDLFEKTNCLSAGPRAIADWSFDNHIDHDHVREVIELIDGLIEFFRRGGRDVSVGNFDKSKALDYLREILQNTFPQNIYSREGKFYVSSSKRRFIYGGYSDIISKTPANIVSIYNVKNVIKFAVDIVVDLGIPGEMEIAIPSIEDAPEKKVIARKAPYHESLVKFANTYDVEQLNLNLTQLKLWVDNFFIRQVFVNAALPGGSELWKFKRVGRSFEKADRELSGSSPRLPYQKKQIGEVRTVEFWGQRKIFVMLVEFLSNYSVQANILIYAGPSLAKTAWSYLAELFPEVTFHLYNQGRKYGEDRVNSYTKSFGPEIAKRWAKKKTLLFYDLREQTTGDDANNDEIDELIEKNVVRGLDRQKRITQALSAEVSNLKFRLPYKKGKTSYFKGTLLIQPWSRATSTENRLIIEKKNIKTFVKYDNTEQEEKMFWHNTQQRTWYYKHNVKDTDHTIGLDHGYDSSAEIFIITEYLKNIKSMTRGVNDKLIEISGEIGKALSQMDINGNYRTLAYPIKKVDLTPKKPVKTPKKSPAKTPKKSPKKSVEKKSVKKSEKKTSEEIIKIPEKVPLVKSVAVKKDELFHLKNIPISYPVKIRNNDEDIVKARKYVYERAVKEIFGEGNIKELNAKQVESLLFIYDEIFFDNLIKKTLAEGKFTLDFKINGGVKKTSAACVRRVGESNTVDMNWTVFEPLFNEEKEIHKANGIECEDRLGCMQLVLEHEMIHLVRNLVDPNVCKGGTIYGSHGALFKTLVRGYFGHTEMRHSLGRNVLDEYSKEDFKVGEKIIAMLKTKSGETKKEYATIKKLNNKSLDVETAQGEWKLGYVYVYKIGATEGEILTKSEYYKTAEKTAIQKTPKKAPPKATPKKVPPKEKPKKSPPKATPKAASKETPKKTPPKEKPKKTPKKAPPKAAPKTTPKAAPKKATPKPHKKTQKEQTTKALQEVYQKLEINDPSNLTLERGGYTDPQLKDIIDRINREYSPAPKILKSKGRKADRLDVILEFINKHK